MTIRVYLPVVGQAVCPATMCPLFAPTGSPWTGEKNGRCPRNEPDVTMSPASGCGFWGERGCDGVGAAAGQIEEAAEHGATFQIGPVRQRRAALAAPTSYECPKAGLCHWQQQVYPRLCPPRHALSLGVDPRASAW